MTAQEQYPFTHHPCFSMTRDNLWSRIHLPVARDCNVKCIFCDHRHGSSCHTSKPGYSSYVMEPSQAIRRIRLEKEKNPCLKIAAISGPGEPLANRETFETLQGIVELGYDFRFCLSTNGVLLSESIEALVELGISTISVTMSAISPNIAMKLYEWARIDNVIQKGLSMGREIVERQLQGIRAAIDSSITVKVNSILIPEINNQDIILLARRIAGEGVQLQNIVPLVPFSNAKHLKPPSTEEIMLARQTAAKYVQQFTHCKQCRSDVVGIPGNDRIL